MFEFHKDRKQYFDIQVANTAKYVIPFIRENLPLPKGSRVLEIGAGEAGVLKAFIDEGCIGVGVELLEERVVNGRKWLGPELAAGKLTYIVSDIYKVDVEKDLGGRFDLIVLKDVIEHIYDQAKLLRKLHSFLLPHGAIFFGFPPWQMPFGGHQQICTNKVLAKMPYYHLLPERLYKFILKKYNQPVKDLIEIRDTRLSLEKFERILKKTDYRIVHRRLFLINPIYQYKFGWKPRVQSSLISRIPWFRNFVTTTAYYLAAPSTVAPTASRI
ncbi:MAG TPA: class I SAM-dependent methyltransferase [Puia sp.]|nr:class I SAM-dependent methyltransferase [Puia sp.]